MRILFVGDIVGTPGVTHALDRISALREEFAIDVVVVNAENAAPDGLGLSFEALETIDSHVDVITGGNHSWDRPDASIVLDHPKVLRPMNVSPDAAGRGIVQLPVAHEVLTVVNLIAADAVSQQPGLPTLTCTPYEAFATAHLEGTVLVDFHGTDVFAKQTFAFAVDGKVAAVLGTHTHEPTLTLHRLPGGTALVTDVGMTGAYGGVMGFQTEAWAAGIRAGKRFDELPIPLPVSGACCTGAVVLETLDGLTHAIERVS